MQVLIIPGVMKCGTSSLFRCLSGHPAVCPSRVKEPEFFSRLQDHGTDGSDYHALFDFDPSVHRVAMDGSTGYSKPGEDAVPDRIRAAGVEPMIVFVLRDPFDRIVSHINHRRRHHDDDRMTDYIVEMSAYCRLIDRFARVFDRLHVTTLDALINEPDEIDAIQVFAGLDRMPLKFWHENRGDYDEDRRTLTAEERADIHACLAPDMARLNANYDVDVSRWGFD